MADIIPAEVYLPEPDEVIPDNFDSGYCTFIPCTFDVPVSSLNSALKNTNAYAYMVTNYEASETDDVPYVIVYIIHKTIPERDLFRTAVNKFCTWGNVPPDMDQVVWFNKHWLLDTYKATRFDTPGKIYRGMLKLNMLNRNDNEEKQLVRLYFMQQYGCYDPIDPSKGLMCKSRKRNEQICVKCCLSRYYSRYKNGKCVKKIKHTRSAKKKSK